MRHYNSQRLKRAKQLRRDMTDGERILWSQLRRGATGYWFRRQIPSGPYVLDFYCAKASLCVEIDGPEHVQRGSSDARRDAHFEALGIETLRVKSLEVFDNLDGVVDEIVRTCQRRTGWTKPGG